MAERVVHHEIVDGVGVVTLDSPSNRNALSRQLLRELSEALADLDDRPLIEVRAIVLRHEGPAFCAGADLKERASTDDGADDDVPPFPSILTTLMDTPRPTIAAVGGAVRAGGIGLMASCDLVVVERSVSFAINEVRIGVAPAIISVPILRRVPPGKLAAAVLTGETFTAEQAREMGLVTHVTDDVVSTIDHLCDGIRRGAPNAVAETKRILRTVPTMDRDTAFTDMARLSAELFGGAEAQEGLQAFRDKRPPHWQP